MTATTVHRILLAVLTVGSPSALAHEPHAHVHGVGNLQVAVDGSTLTLTFSSPLDNLLGFEHAPRNAKEKAAAADLMARLNKPETLLPTAAAACTPAATKLDAPVLEGRAAAASRADGGKDSSAAASSAKGKEAHKHDDKEHAELAVEYVFRCQQPGNLRGVEVKLFDSFRRLRELNVQVAGPKGQSATKLSRSKRIVSW